MVTCAQWTTMPGTCAVTGTRHRGSGPAAAHWPLPGEELARGCGCERAAVAGKRGAPGALCPGLDQTRGKAVGCSPTAYVLGLDPPCCPELSVALGTHVTHSGHLSGVCKSQPRGLGVRQLPEMHGARPIRRRRSGCWGGDPASLLPSAGAAGRAAPSCRRPVSTLSCEPPCSPVRRGCHHPSQTRRQAPRS